MGYESAILSEIEVPNGNISEQFEKPKGGKSQGMGGIYPEGLREINCERGEILTRRCNRSKTALLLKIGRL